MVPCEIDAHESRHRAFAAVRDIEQKVLILRLFGIEEDANLPPGGQAVQGGGIVVTDAEMQVRRLLRDAAEHFFFEQLHQFGTTLFLPFFHATGTGQQVRKRVRRHFLLIIKEALQRVEGQLDGKVRHVQPAGIILGAEPVAPETELRAHPQFRLRLEASLHADKPLAIKAIAESAFRIGNISLHGLCPDIQVHPDDHFRHVGIIDQRNVLRLPVVRQGFIPIRQHRQFADGLGRASVGLQALDIVQPGAVRSIGQPQTGIIVPHHGETGLLAPLLQLRVRPEREPCPDSKPLGRELLRQEIGAVPEASVRPFLLHGIEPDPALRQRIMPIRRRNRRILPREVDAIGAVTVRRFLDCARNDSGRLVISSRGGAGVEKSVFPYRLPHIIPVGIHTDERPAIGLPGHRLQVQYASVSALVLEMEEPVLPSRSIHPGSLMGPVDGARDPGHHDAFLVRPERIVRPQDRLPACSDASGRREDVVLPVPFVEFRSFDGRLAQMPVVHDARRAQQMRPVRSHRRDEQDALVPRPGPGATM